MEYRYADVYYNNLKSGEIDDIEMGITHAFRGEDHLTNTVDQLIIFKALGAPFPKYWHMPLICNKTGKKLSKRDFGFSLEINSFGSVISTGTVFGSLGGNEYLGKQDIFIIKFNPSGVEQ